MNFDKNDGKNIVFFKQKNCKHVQQNDTLKNVNAHRMAFKTRNKT